MAKSVQSSQVSSKRRWSWWKVLLALALVAGAVYAAVARPWEPDIESVKVERLGLRAYSQVLAANGRVVPREEVSVRSSVSGLATAVPVREGDSVAAGDALVQLDPAQPNAVVAQARAALEAGIVRQTQAQATVERARALGENAPRAALEDAQLALAGAMNEVARLTAALEQAQSQLAQYTIRAPIDAVVLERAIDRGQLVDPQSVLFRVADLTELLVETDVDELYSSRIRSGLAALLKPVGDTVAKHGRVVFAAQTVDPATGGRTVRIAFDEAVDLPVGLTVNANIIVSSMEQALTVPRSAIVTEGADSHVLVLENSIAALRAIEFSDWPSERVIVIAGLVEGEAVILDPTAVEAGQQVTAE
jgi:RND family efflux transporter MFP subunit